MNLKFNRRKFIVCSTAALGSSLGFGLELKGNKTQAQQLDRNNTIKVGLLHSLSGRMAISEVSVLDAEKLAIQEINAAGGVLGRQIEPIVEDGASDWPTFRDKAEKLIDRDRVVTIFGVWTSASRKSVLPVVEERDHLLWYPLYYEGMECSKNIFYTGLVPNQQIEPVVDWLLAKKGKVFFLLGSDYVYPRTINAVIKEQLKIQKKGLILGEEYLPLGSTEIRSGIDKIKRFLPKGGTIINSLSGDSNIALFKTLSDAGMTPDRYPVLSLSITEDDILAIGAEHLIGHYAALSYFQTVDSPTNQKWVDTFKAKYGEYRQTSDPMEAAYTMVYLWKQAVEKAGTADDLEAVRQAAIGQSFNAPSGFVTMNANHHLSKPVRIGRVREDGLFDIVWSSPEAIAPQPWNQYIPETRGYACDWSDPSRGRKYRVE
jgi:urea transport system substrate-binding protein